MIKVVKCDLKVVFKKMFETQGIFQRLTSILIVYAYSFACAIYSPLPSEAPMFLFPELSRFEVLLFSALGKATGAYIVFISGATVRQTKIFNKTLSFLRLQSLWLRFSKWTEKFMKI